MNDLSCHRGVPPSAGFQPARLARQCSLGLLSLIALSPIPASAAPATENHPPSASDVLANIDEDTPGVVEMTGTDPDGDQLTYVIVTEPKHGRLSPTQDKPRLFYSPAENYHGEDEFTYKVSDGRTESRVVTAKIVVRGYIDPPELIAPKKLVTSEGKPVVAMLEVRDVDPQGKLVFQIFADPEHGTLKPEGAFGRYIYTPNPKFVGTDSFEIAVHNKEYMSTPATIQVSVISNDPPPAAH